MTSPTSKVVGFDRHRRSGPVTDGHPHVGVSRSDVGILGRASTAPDSDSGFGGLAQDSMSDSA